MTNFFGKWERANSLMELKRNNDLIMRMLSFDTEMKEFPIYVCYKKEDDVGTYLQIKCFKGLTQCLFKNNIFPNSSLFQIRNKFKKDCDFVIGYRIERNKRIDFIPKGSEIPKGSKIICEELKSCGDMGKKELTLLIKAVINFGDDYIPNMNDDGVEWCGIRDEMDLKAFERTRKHFESK